MVALVAWPAGILERENRVSKAKGFRAYNITKAQWELLQQCALRPTYAAEYYKPREALMISGLVVDCGGRLVATDKGKELVARILGNG